MLEEKWHESKIDPKLFLELQDLAVVLSGSSNLRLAFSNASFIDLKARELSLSSLWDPLGEDLRMAGYKTDLYLRALGTMQEIDFSSLTDLASFPSKSLAKQLFTLLEDLRLEELIKRKRPGTARAFKIRRKYLRSFFASQLRRRAVRAYPADQLFSGIYLLLAAEGPEPSLEGADPELIKLLEKIKPLLQESFEVKSSQDVSFLIDRLLYQLDDEFLQLNRLYFAFPIRDMEQVLPGRRTKEQLKRTDDLENKDLSEEEAESDFFDERLESWHQEAAPNDQRQSFLQMDLELGTKTKRRGKTARQTESGDQVFATAQAAARKTKQTDYTKFSSAEEKTDETLTSSSKEAPYGRENLNALALWQKAEEATSDNIRAYAEVLSSIEGEKKRLLKTIEKSLEQKRKSPRGNLHYGRLSKKLLPLVTEDFPKVFYKKDEQSKEFDAVFSLLVDCSASMDKKMPQVKRGIALFHEALKSIRVQHSITGFWEEASSTLSKEQANYFLDIYSFEDSLYANQGAKIMQLAAKEDNRDGFSIRIVSELLLPRREKQKILLVFTDGEPAADGYFENGIVDTKIAVSTVRRRGIHILGVFLADGPVREADRRLMETIYGRDFLIVRDLKELPALVGSLLRRMLLPSI